MDIINIYILLLTILKAATSKGIPNYSESGNRYPRQVSGNGCQIPVDQHGQYKIVNNSGQFTAETYVVNEFTLVILNCDTSYKKSPPGFKYSLCENGLWSPLYKCESTCSTLSSTESTKIRCYFNNVQLESCESPLDGTVAEYDCQPYYENYLSGNSFVECHRGVWIGIKHECSPICGEKRSVGTPNIINGTNVRKGSYPWQVAIYKCNKEFICGGSIISQKIILTAAHCLCDSDDGTSFPKQNYLVAVGKHYRPYNDSRDIGAQYPTIESIHAPNQYRGDILQYESDIAVIILTKNLVLSDVVQPICVDWFGRYESEQLMLNNNGVVTGWGYTMEGDNLSDELKVLNVPYIPYDQCFRQVPNNFTKYVRSDKICSGYLDLGTSVCQGDSGGALAFPLLFNGKYYVRGIVSVSPATTDNTCNSRQYGLYTSLSKYLNFVRGFYLTNELFSKSESTPLTTPLPTTTINENARDVPTEVDRVEHPCQKYIDVCSTIRCEFDIETYVDNETLCTRCRCRDPCQNVICDHDSKCAIDLNRNSTYEDPTYLAVCRQINKEGNCPYNSDRGNDRCNRECENDADCTMDLKCCPSGCSTSCTPPAALRPVPLQASTQPRSRAEKPVRVNITQHQARFLRGSEISVVCDVEGYPIPTVQWFKDGHQLLPSSFIQISASHGLHISNAQESDSGEYRCEAANDYSRSAATIGVTIEGVYIHPNCTDNQFYANCHLIIRSNYCVNSYYAKWCCKSCTEAGQLPSYVPQIDVRQTQ